MPSLLFLSLSLLFQIVVLKNNIFYRVFKILSGRLLKDVLVFSCCITKHLKRGGFKLEPFITCRDSRVVLLLPGYSAGAVVIWWLTWARMSVVAHARGCRVGRDSQAQMGCWDSGASVSVCLSLSIQSQTSPSPSSHFTWSFYEVPPAG